MAFCTNRGDETKPELWRMAGEKALADLEKAALCLLPCFSAEANNLGFMLMAVKQRGSLNTGYILKKECIYGKP
jgi:hypothetical protein